MTEYAWHWAVIAAVGTALVATDALAAGGAHGGARSGMAGVSRGAAPAAQLHPGRLPSSPRIQPRASVAAAPAVSMPAPAATSAGSQATGHGRTAHMGGSTGGAHGKGRHSRSAHGAHGAQPQPTQTGVNSLTPAQAAAAAAELALIQAQSSVATGPPPAPVPSAGAAQMSAPVTQVQQAQPAPDPVSTQSGGATAQRYGGGGATLGDCMALWDTSSHMTRAEWRATCRRTLNGLELPIPKL